MSDEIQTQLYAEYGELEPEKLRTEFERVGASIEDHVELLSSSNRGRENMLHLRWEVLKNLLGVTENE